MQVRLHVPQRLALVRARDDRRQADLGVVQQQARELATGVPGDTDDGDADGHRAIMRLSAYLCNWVFQATANNCFASGTPFSSCRPRSVNVKPAPATRSFTVLETSTSPGAARPPMRAVTWTAMPRRAEPATSTSPV